MQAKQKIVSYMASCCCLIMLMGAALMKLLEIKGVSLELVLGPIALNSLQIFVLKYLQAQSDLHKKLLCRQKENRISIIENIFIITFCISMTLAYRIRTYGFFIPYTAACFPLALMLFIRFILYKSICKAFRNTYNLLKYIIQFLIITLIVNFTLKYDNFFSLDIIAILWPLYGFIALSFIFFMASLLLFIGSCCNTLNQQGPSSFISSQDQEDEDITFTFPITTWILLNCGSFSIQSIMGFLILLKYVDNGTVFLDGFYGIICCYCITLIFTAFSFQKCTQWYLVKMLKPQIKTELTLIAQMNRNSRSRSPSQDRNRIQRNNNQQSLQNRDQNPQIKKDLQELNRIEFLDEQPSKIKQEVLSSVPRFIVRISNSYYQKVEQYTKSFFGRLTRVDFNINKKKHFRKKLPNIMSKAQLYQKQFQKFKGKGKGKTRQAKHQDTDIDKLSIADERTNYKVQQQVPSPKFPNETKKDVEEQGSVFRMCFTSQLQTIQVCESLSTEQQKTTKKQKRRNSFDTNLLRPYGLKDEFINPKLMKEQLLLNVKYLQQDKVGITQTYSSQTQKTNNELLQVVDGQEKDMCMLCLEQKSNAVILECGHANICFMCAFKLYRTQKQCHLCRNEISKIVKVQRTNGLDYHKVLGVIQFINNKYFYSDITQDVQNFKIQPIKDIKSLDLLKSQETECQLDTQCIDEGSINVDNQIYVLDVHDNYNHSNIEIDDQNKKRRKSV